MTEPPSTDKKDFDISFGFFDQFIKDDEGDESGEEELSTDVMGLLNPHNPGVFPESHVIGAIFEPIKEDVKPDGPSQSGNSNFFSQYAQMDDVENPDWKFGSKAPMADNLILRGIHNLLHRNSIASMQQNDMKGISKIDLDGAFLGGSDDEDGSVAELFEELSTMEFEKPNLREVRRNIGRDKDLFDMVTNLAGPHLLQ